MFLENHHYLVGEALPGTFQVVETRMRRSGQLKSRVTNPGQGVPGLILRTKEC
jgi:hypothetical protein